LISDKKALRRFPILPILRNLHLLLCGIVLLKPLLPLPILVLKIITHLLLRILQIAIQLLLVVHKEVLPIHLAVHPLLELLFLLLHEIVEDFFVQVHFLDYVSLEVQVLTVQDVVQVRLFLERVVLVRLVQVVTRSTKVKRFLGN
jgi:hypothetical protein